MISLTNLLPTTRAKILEALFSSTERIWYLRELARHLDLQPSSIQLEIESMIKTGILVSSRDGNRKSFALDPSSPLYDPLKLLVERTSTWPIRLSQILLCLPIPPRLAVVYGSTATGKSTNESDIDLLVIGETPLSDLAQPLLKFAEDVGRPVNPTMYTTAEFCEKVAAKNHFVRQVLESPLKFIIGSQDDLARLCRPS